MTQYVRKILIRFEPIESNDALDLLGAIVSDLRLRNIRMLGLEVDGGNIRE